jgi:hypothetical protein
MNLFIEFPEPLETTCLMKIALLYALHIILASLIISSTIIKSDSFQIKEPF